MNKFKLFIYDILLKEQIIRKVFYLVVMFFLSSAVLIGLEGLFHVYTKGYDTALRNQQSRYNLGKIILKKLLLLELDTQAIASATDSRDLPSLEGRIKASVNDIYSVLKVLQGGGVYEDVVPANFGNVNEVRERISFSRDNESGYVIEVIDLTPKIIDIEQVTTSLVAVLLEKFNPGGIKRRTTLDRRAAVLLKQAHAVLSRSREIANKIFYDTGIEVERLKQQKEIEIQRLLVIRYSVIGVVGAVEVFIFILIISQTRGIVAERETDRKELRKLHNRLGGLVLERTRDLQQALDGLKKAQTELIQTEKLASLGQLAAGIAHEINTPSQFVGDNIKFLQDAHQDLHKLISSFTGFLLSVKQGGLSEGLVQGMEEAVEEADLDFLFEEVPKAIEQSQEGVQRIGRIVRSMKQFSHPGAKDKTSADINKCIETTVTVCRNEWKYVAEMVMNLDRSIPPVPLYQNEFNQVILNMILNASLAIKEKIGESPEEKGTITITTGHDEKFAEVRIQDTGAGIPEEIRGKIFDPFFTSHEVGEGTGQGLAISHSVIVEKHAGALSFETEVGKGTMFIIRLPLHGEAS